MFVSAGQLREVVYVPIPCWLVVILYLSRSGPGREKGVVGRTLGGGGKRRLINNLADGSRWRREGS